MFVGLFAVLCFSCLRPPVAAAGEVPSLHELIKQLDLASHRLMNVEVHFESWEEHRDSAGSWQRTGLSAAGTAWLNGAYHSKGRIHYDKEISEWQNGPAPKYEQSSDLGFDGREGRIAVYSGGPVGNTVPIAHGEILPGAPPELFGGPAEIRVGAWFSTPLAQYSGGRTLARAMALELAAGTPVEIAADSIDNTPAYRVTVHRRPGRDAILWLDPARGYAFLGNRSVTAGKVTTESHVTKVVEAGPGIWYPAEAYLERDMPGNKGVRERVYYRASKVVANDPKFDEAIFKFSFPPNCRIEDRVRNRSYITAPTPKELESDLNRTLDQTVAELGRSKEFLDRPAAPLPTNGPSSRGAAAPNTAGPNPSTSRTPMAWAAFGAAALIAMAAAGLRWRRTRGSAVAILLLASAMMPGARADGGTESILQAPDSGDYHSNCGLNVSYVTLHLLGQDVTVAQVAKGLNVGPLHEQQCSLAQLKAQYESRGLSVQGLRADSVTDVIDAAKSRGRVLNLKLTTSDGTGHFVVLVSAGDDLLLLDPPSRPFRFHAPDGPQLAMLKLASPEFLSVSRPPPAAAVRPGPAISLASRSLDAGETSATTDEVWVKLPFRSVGTERLKIVDVKGSCFCFAGFEGDRELPPGATGEIRVKFDKAKLPDGPATRQVLIRTNDVANSSVVVQVHFVVRHLPEGRDVVITPRQFEYGRIRQAKLHATEERLTVALPILSSADASIPQVSVAPSGGALAVRELDRAVADPAFPDRKTWHFAITIAQPPRGTLDEMLTVRIGQNAGEQTFTVPVQAQVVE